MNHDYATSLVQQYEDAIEACAYWCVRLGDEALGMHDLWKTKREAVRTEIIAAMMATSSPKEISVLFIGTQSKEE